MRNGKPLTVKQKIVLDFINNYQIEHNISPTLREVASFLGTKNISTAQYFVEQIKVKGHISKSENVSRGITSSFNASSSIPLLGRIAAGSPIEAIEDVCSIDIPNNIKLNPSASYYALQVVGDSMIDMGILDEDIVLIQHQLTANNGDVVVAIVDGGATLKVFKRIGDQITLEARNASYDPIISKNIEVRGKFIGLIRIK